MIILRLSYDENDVQAYEENFPHEIEDVQVLEEDADIGARRRQVLVNAHNDYRRIKCIRPYIRVRENWLMLIIKYQAFVIPLALLLISSAVVSDHMSFLSNHTKNELHNIYSENTKIMKELENTLHKIESLKETLVSIEIGERIIENATHEDLKMMEL